MHYRNKKYDNFSSFFLSDGIEQMNKQKRGLEYNQFNLRFKNLADMKSIFIIFKTHQMDEFLIGDTKLLLANAKENFVQSSKLMFFI